MWHWFRNYRRKKILASPFPGSWKKHIQNNIPYYQHLDNDEKKHLHELIQIFIAEKHWLGCNGLKMTEEIQVVIAAHACLMVLALPNDYYSNVESIYVYPTTVVSPESPTGYFEIRTAPVNGPLPISGEAHERGPVILVWDEVKKETRHPEHGLNVVYHEFAHKLDMLDGSSDGTPPLATAQEYQRWKDVCSREYLQLCDRVDHGEPTFFDSYATTNESEFFAVVTESFFSNPQSMKHHHPELYRVLQDFFRQDPAQKIITSECP